MRAIPLAAIAASLLVLAACASPPVADAGPDQTVAKGALVTLDGSASSDPGGKPLTHNWSQDSGPQVTLAIVDGKPTFTAPDMGATLVFSLVVSNGAQESKPDSVTIIVANQPPVADAGADQNVSVGSTVYLRGWNSSDPDGDFIQSYQWSQVSGTPVTLNNANGSTASFTAPPTAGALTFKLVVGDGAASGEDTVVVNVFDSGGNQPPSAWAGSNQTVARGATVTLSSSGSYDPDGDTLTYAWAQLSGTTVTLNTPTAATTTFTAPSSAATMVFELTVSDGMFSDTDQVQVTVQNATPVISSASLTPASPKTLDDLTAVATITDADGDTITTTYAWTQNGTTVAGQTSATFPHALTTKGDVIGVTITATDGSATATRTLSATIQDTPTVFTSTAPATVAHCGAVSFTVSGSDPDGDPVPTFALDYGPAGMTFTGGNTVNWTACLPMFDTTLDVSWSVVTEATPQGRITGTIQVTDAARLPPLTRSGFEIPTRAGLQVVDLDANGTREVLIASVSVLYELGKTAGTAYEQRWVYPFGTPDAYAYRSAVAANVQGDAKPELFFSSSKYLVKLDGATRREVARMATSELGGDGCHDLEVADLSGDGDLELVCLALSSSYSTAPGVVAVIDPVTLTVEWQTASDTYGTNVALGNVDADAAVELVLPNGMVFDGATAANQWFYSATGGFGSYVDTGDLTGDGIEEIVGILSGSLRGFDAVTKTADWTYSGGSGSTFLVANFETDTGAAKDEIILGSTTYLYGYRYDSTNKTLTQSFQLSHANYGTSAIAMGDLDGDGRPELVAGVGSGDSGEDNLVVVGRNPSTLSIEWANTGPSELDPPFRGAVLARPTAGVTSLMFAVAETDNGYAGGRLISMNPTTGALDLSGAIGSGFYTSSMAMAPADYDGDGTEELFLSYESTVAAYNPVSKTTEWTAANAGLAVAIAAGDVTGDAAPDLLMLTSDGYLVAHDVKNQTLPFKSTALGTAADFAHVDLDGDGVKELVALLASGLHVYERNSAPSPLFVARGTVTWTSGDAVDLAVGDLDADGAVELYVLHGAYYASTKKLRRIGADLVDHGAVNVSNELVSIFVENLGAGRKNLVASGSPYSTVGVSTLRALDPETGAIIWRSPPLLGDVSQNGLSYVTLGSETVPRIAFASEYGMNLTR